MRKIVCVLILGGLSLVGSAGFCQSSSPGLSDRPGQGWVGPDPSIWGMIGAPTLHASWAVSGSMTASPTASGSLSQSFLAGPLLGYSVSGNVGVAGNGEGRLRSDVRGLWVGATIPVRLSNALTLRTRGEYFFPSSHRIRASLHGGSSGQAASTGYFGVVPLATLTASGTGQGQLELDASAETRWVVVDAELTYPGLRRGTFLLAGIRYDRLETAIGSEAASSAGAGSLTIAVANGGSISIAGAASGSVTIPAAASVIAELHTVSPYLGIRVSTGVPSGALAFEVKGFPAVFVTRAAHRNLERENAYFGEFKAEYSGSLARNLSASVFVTGDMIHATFTDLTDFTNLFTIGGIGLPGLLTPGQLNIGTDVSTSIHWNQLSVGESLLLRF